LPSCRSRPRLSKCHLVSRFASISFFSFFFFTNPATTEISTLSLHDALPIFAFLAGRALARRLLLTLLHVGLVDDHRLGHVRDGRSEEHTSELQSLRHLVCRLLLEKKNKN